MGQRWAYEFAIGKLIANRARLTGHWALAGWPNLLLRRGLSSFGSSAYRCGIDRILHVFFPTFRATADHRDADAGAHRPKNRVVRFTGGWFSGGLVAHKAITDSGSRQLSQTSGGVLK